VRLLLKLSGKVLEDPAVQTALCRQVSTLREKGHDLVVVHGAGKQLDEFCRERGIPVVQYEGRRVTDQATLDSAKKVFSAINRDLTARLLTAGIAAVGISAFDGGLTQSRRRKPFRLGDGQVVDFGFVAEIEAVRTAPILTLWSGGYLPVISSLCADAAGQVLNINADTLATELAVALAVDRVVALSDVEGIYRNSEDPDSRIARLSLKQARGCLSSGVLKGGMIPKVQNAIGLLERGVPEFQLVSGLREGALAGCLDSEVGTLIFRG